LHVDIETDVFCGPIIPEAYSTTIVTIAKTVAIIIKYSKEPCALIFIKKAIGAYKIDGRATSLQIRYRAAYSGTFFSSPALNGPSVCSFKTISETSFVNFIFIGGL